MKNKKKGDGYYIFNDKNHWSEKDDNILLIIEIPFKKDGVEIILLRQLMGIEVIEDNDKNEKKEKKDKKKMKIIMNKKNQKIKKKTNYIKRYENKTFWK